MEASIGLEAIDVFWETFWTRHAFMKRMREAVVGFEDVAWFSEEDEGNIILHDIDLTINEKDVIIDSKTIRAIVVLSQMNLHIWHNESNYRKGIKDGNNLELTHGLNGIRNTAKNIIQELDGGRKDYKIDCLAADFKDWEISWDE